MSKDTAPFRDHELGAALRELEVPEHRPEFHAELHRRLAEHRRARLAEARRQRRARRGSVRWAVRAALVAAVAALAFVAYDAFRSEDSPAPGLGVVETATAAEIKAQVERALASARNLSGILVYDGSEKGDERRWRFVLTDQGDFRLTGVNLVDNIAYDASTGVERSLNPSASMGGDTLFPAERRGIAPGPPDPGPSSWSLPRDFGAFVRALLAAQDPRVREVRYDGREAWRLDVAVLPNAVVPQFSGDGFEITVDRATGIPVRVVETKRGAFFRELRIENLAVDREIPRETFTIDFPAGAEVGRSDDGFRRPGGLEPVAGLVGYRPLVPGSVPEGYELAEVAVAPGRGFPTGAEAGNPDSADVVSLSYRRGLDQFVVTTRLRHVPGFPDIWDDPFRGEGLVWEPERIVARRGALSGVELNLVIVPRTIPHIWGLTDELVVTVSGDLSRAELLQVTESLEPRS
jgi:hypothetical protein